MNQFLIKMDLGLFVFYSWYLNMHTAIISLILLKIHASSSWQPMATDEHSLLLLHWISVESLYHKLYP